MAQVTVRQRFAPGQRVGLYERVGDWYSLASRGDSIKDVYADEEGSVVFGGLVAGHAFWVAPVEDPGPGTAVTAKDIAAGQTQRRISGELAGQARAGQIPADQIVTGARDSLTGKPRKTGGEAG